MKSISLYALANEMNFDPSRSGEIRIPFGTWDFGTKKLDDGSTVFFTQTLAGPGASRIAEKINSSVASGEKGVPVYWGHPDVPELAHKYPDKRAKGWVKSATVDGNALVLAVEWLDENATDGFGWFSPYWGGPATDLGQGRYLKTIDKLASIALVNIPNIQEFRLANEAQPDKPAYELPQNIVALANEYDESKHLRADDGKWSSAPGGGASSATKPSVADTFKAAAKKAAKDPMAIKFNDALKTARKNKDGAGIARAHMAALKAGMVWDKSIKGYRPPVAK